MNQIRLAMTQSSLNKNSINNTSSDSPLKVRKAKAFKRWSSEENLVYATFLRDNKEFFQNQYKRRSERVFKKLSQILYTKSIIQCKSHHQKMLRYNNSIDNIINKFLPDISSVRSEENKQRMDDPIFLTKFFYQEKSQQISTHSQIRCPLYFNAPVIQQDSWLDQLRNFGAQQGQESAMIL